MAWLLSSVSRGMPGWACSALKCLWTPEQESVHSGPVCVFDGYAYKTRLSPIWVQ